MIRGLSRDPLKHISWEPSGKRKSDNKILNTPIFGKVIINQIKTNTVPTHFFYFFRTRKQRNKSEWVVTKMRDGSSTASKYLKNSVTKMRNVTKVSVSKMSGDSIHCLVLINIYFKSLVVNKSGKKV